MRKVTGERIRSGRKEYRYKGTTVVTMVMERLGKWWRWNKVTGGRERLREEEKGYGRKRKVTGGRER